MDDSSRKQFEEKFSYLDLTRDWGISDFYDDNKTQSAWEAWQAGRASMRDEAATACDAVHAERTKIGYRQGFNAIMTVKEEIQKIQP
jgi:hypothetical protein